jgi:hypothetical protein
MAYNLLQNNELRVVTMWENVLDAVVPCCYCKWSENTVYASTERNWTFLPAGGDRPSQIDEQRGFWDGRLVAEGPRNLFI